MCTQTQILGVDRDRAFAEYVAAPESVIWQNDRAKLPPEIATLQEPFGNAVYASLLHDLTGQTVAVFGCGQTTSSPLQGMGMRQSGFCRPPEETAWTWSWR